MDKINFDHIEDHVAISVGPVEVPKQKFPCNPRPLDERTAKCNIVEGENQVKIPPSYKDNIL